MFKRLAVVATFGVALLGGAGVVFGIQDTPTLTPTVTPTLTPTATPTATVNTATPTNTPTATATNTPTRTNTGTPTNTPTTTPWTPTRTPTNSPTSTPSQTPTSTPTATSTAVPAPTSVIVPWVNSMRGPVQDAETSLTGATAVVVVIEAPATGKRHCLNAVVLTSDSTATTVSLSTEYAIWRSVAVPASTTVRLDADLPCLNTDARMMAVQSGSGTVKIAARYADQ